MLVLSRKLNETIVIGHEITITVVDIRGDKVRLGIACDTDIPIHRGEIEEKIEQQKKEQKRKESRDNPSD